MQSYGNFLNRKNVYVTKLFPLKKPAKNAGLIIILSQFFL